MLRPISESGVGHRAESGAVRLVQTKNNGKLRLSV